MSSADVPLELPPPTADGTFAKTPLVQVLIYVLERGLTGTLEITHPGGPWEMLLVIEGAPAKVRSSEPVAYLGNVLLELGLVDDQTLNASLAAMAKEAPTRKALHGQILREMGKLTDEQLYEGLRAQLQKKIEHMFDWPGETRFAYYDGFDALHTYGGEEIVTIDPVPLVWSAIRTQPPWEHVHAMLTRTGNAAMKIAPGAQLDRFEFNKEERAAADILRVQPMRLHDLAATKLLGASTTQLLCYCLLITKQVELVQLDAKQVARVQLAQVAQRSVVEERSAAISDPRAPEPSIPEIRLEEIMKGVPLPRPPSDAPPGDRLTLPALPGNSVTPELEKRRQDITKRAASIKGEDFFQMLGVKPDATPDQVNAAFFALAKVWHPDRVPAPIADVREQCSMVFAHMSEAHQTLSDPKRREQYMTLLREGGATPDEQAHVQAVLEAAMNFQKAEFYLKKGETREAEVLCRKAYEADPKPPEYGAMLAWLESLKPENQGVAATQARLEMLDRAIAANERLERAYFYRGMLYKRLGNGHKAMADFRKSADLNPRNIDAVREVRLFEMRKSRGSIPPEADEAPSSKRTPNTGGPKAGSSKKDTDPSLGRLFGKLFKK
jgi:curved DNA-binding protein CbpA